MQEKCRVDDGMNNPTTQRLVTNIAALLRRAPLFNAATGLRQKYDYQRWLANGRPVPPPHLVKQMTIGEFAATRPDLRVFVETGTYFGDMVYAVRNVFSSIYSIELSAELHVLARTRFSGMPRVRLLHGDSGELLGQALREIEEPCLFWLDGHYSAGVTARGATETPIERELAHIANHAQRNRHVVLIDDARCFTGMGDYPTIDHLRAWAVCKGFDQFVVRDDIVRISSSIL